MNAQQLISIFQNVNGASFVGIDTCTIVPLTGGKKNPQLGRVTKTTTGANVMVFQNKTINGYEAMVKRRIAAEGLCPNSFVLGDRAWGKRLENLPLIEHEKDGVTKYYVEVIFLKAGTSAYFLDGQPINKGDIIGLKDENSTADKYKVIIRSYAADSIVAVRVDGKEYK